MMETQQFLACTLVPVCILFIWGVDAKAGNLEGKFLYGNFPPDFKWGMANSAYQSEGASYADGKGLTNIDYLFRENINCGFPGCSNADLGSGSYYKFPEDHTLLRNIGVDYYRLSISWARIVPTGRVRDGVNWAGIDHYSEVFDDLLAQGIQPWVTLFHFDLPLPLYWAGGWKNPEIIRHFRDFANIAFHHFGDRVKIWLSFNEPQIFCLGDISHLEKLFEYPTRTMYITAHNVIKAHAVAWRLYDEKYRPRQRGLMSIALWGFWAEPLNKENPDHVKTSARVMQFSFGWFAYPLFAGEYPPMMRKLVDGNSMKEGLSKSRLPTFSPKWTKIVNGSIDFWGLNNYFTYNVKPAAKTNWTPLSNDAAAHIGHDPSWPITPNGWPVTPFGMRKLLQWIGTEYGNRLPIYITENGLLTYSNVTTNDPERIQFFRDYTNEVLKAILLDGVNVKSYTAWTLTDNFQGFYRVTYGVHYINFTDPKLKRIPKDSAFYLKQLFADNGFPPPSLNGPSCTKNHQCSLKLVKG